MNRTPVAAACLVYVALVSSAWAQASAQAQFCRIQGADGCATVVDVSGSAVLNVRGRLPTDALNSGHTLTIEHLGSGKVATVPLRLFKDAQATAQALAGAAFAESNAAQLDRGAEALVYTSSLMPGEYRVKSATIQTASGPQTVELGLDGGARFVLSGGGTAGITISQGGSVVASGLQAVRSANQMLITGYPALRNGAYTLNVSIGSVSASRNFNLQRPVRSVSVDLPFVEGLPEVGARMVLNNTLLGRGLTGTVSFVNDSTETVSINGAEVAPGQSFNVDFLSGLGSISVGNDSPSFGDKQIALFNQAPDGENVLLDISRWRVEDQYLMQPSKTSAAIKVDQITVSPTKIASSTPKCAGVRFYQDGDRLFESTNILCAVQWLDRKGVDIDRFQPNTLRGALQEVGPNVLSYRPGVIYTNPVTKQTAFYPSRSGSATFQIEGTPPAAPTIAFSPYSLYQPLYARMGLPDSKRLVRLSPSDATSGQLMGNINVSAPYAGLRTRISYGDGSSREFLTSFNRGSYAVTPKISDALQEQPIVVESWYDRAPEIKTTQLLTAVGVPIGISVFPDRNRTFHTEDDVVVMGRVGESVGTRIDYSPGTHGAWQIRLYDATDKAEIGRSVVQADGTFAINLGRQPASQRRLMAVAHLMVDGQPSDFTAQTSQDFFINIFDGRAPVASLSTKTDAGSIPFSATASVVFEDPRQSSVADPASWEISADAGATWQPLVDERGRQTIGQMVNRRFTNPGQYMLRATLRNKYSGQTYVTEPAALQAFLRGTARVNVASAAAVNTTITATADLQGFDATPVIRWQLLKGSQVLREQSGGMEFSFTQDQPDTYMIRLQARDSSAPDVASSWVTREVGVRVVNPLAASASIEGPVSVEVGKTYRYTARINDVLPASVTKNYTLRGAWLLPDGQRIEANEADITIQPGQSSVVFVTWVDGSSASERLNVYTVRPWTYVWPAWALDLQPQSNQVPAQLRYTLRPQGTSLADLRGEPINVQWLLPDNVAVTPDGMGGRITIEQAGRYQLIARVSDSRGNITEITTPEIEILPPAQVAGRMTLVSPYGPDKFYAPGKYTVSYRIDSIPKGDRFLKNELLINGNKIGEFTGSSAIVDVTTPGAYDIAVRTLTQSGNWGETVQTVQMQEAPKPTCTFARTQNTSGVTITPTCAVAAGSISSYQWTYILRGEQQNFNSRSLYLRTADLPTVANIVLRVTASTGSEEAFSVPAN